jgi:hypothetical protein
VEQQHDLNNYHPMTASSSSRASATTTNASAMGEQHTTESVPSTPLPTPPLFNLHEYFKPVFDELDKLNKMLDSFIEEENDKAREKKNYNQNSPPAAGEVLG